MAGSLFVAVAAALICTALVLILREMLLTPVITGDNTSQLIILRVFGSEPKLEATLRSLIWLADNGIIHGRIIICGFDLDEETLFVARSFQQDYSGITLIQDGEICQWIRNLSC